MENSLYTGLSRQMALRSEMDLVANNIANMSTPGYRGQRLIFREFVEKETARHTPEKDALSMVEQYGQFQTTTPGTIKSTGNPLDVAVQGRGYFGIQTGAGTMYTRAGNFQMNAEGELINGNNELVADEGGGTITIPAGTRHITITQDGSVSTENGIIGRLMVVEFADEQALEPVGNGLYKTAQAGLPAEDSRVMQGMLEGSNVNSITEMTRMIDVSRAYESSAKMLQTEHDRQRSMIQTLSRSN